MRMIPMSLLAAGCFLLVAADAEAVKKEEAKLKGVWSLVSLVEPSGEKVPEEVVKDAKVVFNDGKMTVKIGGQDHQVVYKLDPGLKPPAIDWTDEKGKVSKGIYELKGDDLKICGSGPDFERPKDFKTNKETKTGLIILKRDKP